MSSTLKGNKEHLKIIKHVINEIEALKDNSK